MSNTWISLIALAGPLAHLSTAWLAERSLGKARFLRLSRVTAAFAFGCALVATVAAFTAASPGGFDATFRGLGIAILLDRLSVTFGLVIGALGFVVLDYSRKYLSGEFAQASFMGRLHSTLGLVTLVSYSGNVLQLLVLWSATSFALHRLLFFYSDRPKVRRAALQKFRMARAGDLMLAVGCVILYGEFGTGSLLDLAHQASLQKSDYELGSVSLAGLLLVGAATLKSGQVPNHVWLPDVIEAPTPVSALLHAGIVNGGGFLMLRFADVVSVSWLPPAVLLVIGAVSALWGSLVMLTKSSVKEALAYSTVGQMGFMLFECALGAYEMAMLHIVAHSAYKAYAFLSAGELSRGASRGQRDDSLGAFVGRWLVSAAVLLLGKQLIHGDVTQMPLRVWVLLGIVASAMSLVSAAGNVRSHGGATSRQIAWMTRLTLLVGLGGAYLLVELFAETLWGDLLWARRQESVLTGGLGCVFALVFAAVAFAQSAQLYRLPLASVQRAYVRVKQDSLARVWFARCWGWGNAIQSKTSGQPAAVLTKDACQEL